MHIEDAGGSATALNEILITDELAQRPCRPVDHLAENRALHALTHQMARQPRAVLRTLVTSARELCQAGSAGVSLLEAGAGAGEGQFRWVAVAGAYRDHEGGRVPAPWSPCGVCLERRAPQLYAEPARHFTWLGGVEPPIVEGLVIPLVAADGAPLGTVWIVSHDSGRRFDVEDVRLMTALADHTATALRLESLEEENARLAREVAEANQARERAEATLREAHGRKDEFLAMLAHELRNPLAPIRTGLQILKYTAGDNRPIEPLRAMMERQVDHLTRLVDDLLDVSRMTRGKIELRKEEVDLTTVLGRVVEANRSSFMERHHELVVGWPEGPILMDADPIRIEQVLDNLLNNACKYTDPGGSIRLTATREEEGTVVIRVSDTGIGLAPEKLPHIFDLFMQAERRLDRSQGGLGIGLSLVRSLAGMHGGSVTAHSDGLGKGSEFVLRLPALPPSPASTRHREDPTVNLKLVTSLPRRRILVVDDNLDSARTMALLLRRSWGQEVEVVYDGTAAIETAIAFRPELILLDIGLPGMSGYEVARTLRGRPELAGMLIVAMTGWGQDEDRQKSKEAGFDYHLTKPVDPEAIRSILTEALPSKTG